MSPRAVSLPARTEATSDRAPSPPFMYKISPPLSLKSWANFTVSPAFSVILISSLSKYFKSSLARVSS